MHIMLDDDVIKYCVTWISPLVYENGTNQSEVLKGDAVEIAYLNAKVCHI